jgi:mono/diheme cytochrome c family protein
MSNRIRPATLAAIALAALLASACNDVPESSNAGVPPPSAPPQVEPQSQPADAQRGPLDGEDLARSRTLFKANCATCHLESGTGDPHHRRDGIPNFRDASWQGRVSDDALTASVRNGKGKLMPGFATSLSDEEITLLVRYVRALPGLAPIATDPTAERHGSPERSARTQGGTPKGKRPSKPAEPKGDEHEGHGGHP